MKGALTMKDKLLKITSTHDIKRVLKGKSNEQQLKYLQEALNVLYVVSEEHIEEHNNVAAIEDLSRMAILEDYLSVVENRLNKKVAQNV